MHQLSYNFVLDARENLLKFGMRKPVPPSLQLETARSELQQCGPVSTGLCCQSYFIPGFSINHCYKIIIVSFHVSVFLPALELRSWEYLLLDAWTKIRVGGGKLC